MNEADSDKNNTPLNEANTPENITDLSVIKYIETTIDTVRSESEKTVFDTVSTNTLTAIKEWTDTELSADDTVWNDDNFTAIQLLDECPNNVWVGPVDHKIISEDPPLVATLYRQKMQHKKRDAVPKNSLHFFVSDKEIQRQTITSGREDFFKTEKISFNLEFDFDGPGRHSLKHRNLAPEFRGKGLGSKVLAIYENLIQEIANKGNETQYSIVDTNKLDTLLWAHKNSYVPDTDTDRELWEQIQTKPTNDLSEIMLGPEQSLRNASTFERVYIKFCKDFPPAATSQIK